MIMHTDHDKLVPKLMSFDVFGTLISVRDSTYAAFASIWRTVMPGMSR